VRLGCVPLGDMRITSYLRMRRAAIMYAKDLSPETITTVRGGGWSNVCVMMSTGCEIHH
jgi:hypothetical protein